MIPLDPCDAPKFAFSIPSVNASEPNKRYHWTVLPEGMKNSPAICQWFVARALSPAREKLPNALIYHYMDDILVATRTESEMQIAMSVVLDNIKLHHLEVAPEKVQKTTPWNYLGWRITNQHIIPQKLKIITEVQTLNDMQKLLGTINWVRPLLGITNEELHPLFQLLKGDPALNSKRTLTQQAKLALQKVATAMSERQAQRCDPDRPFQLIILNPDFQPYGLIFQWDEKQIQ